MEYRAKGYFDWLTWLLLNGLIWTGVVGIAWNMLRPGGWLYWSLDLIEREQPDSYYYLAAGVCGLLAGKFWLDRVDPRAFHHLLSASGAFAGTFYILSLLLHL